MLGGIIKYMNTFTNEELKNIWSLINIAPIKGSDAMTVAILQQKINGLLTEEATPPKGTGSAPEEDTSTKK